MTEVIWDTRHSDPLERRPQDMTLPALAAAIGTERRWLSSLDGEKSKEGWQMISNPVENDMAQAQGSSNADDCGGGAQPPASKIENDLRELQQSRITLAENEEWLDSNSDKLISK